MICYRNSGEIAYDVVTTCPVRLAHQMCLRAMRQRIVEFFPPTHRRVSNLAIRQRIVEIGGGLSHFLA